MRENARRAFGVRQGPLSSVIFVAHRLEPGGRRVDVHRYVSARAPRDGSVPVAFARRHHDGVTSVEILVPTALHLNTHTALDDEQPLRT